MEKIDAINELIETENNKVESYPTIALNGLVAFPSITVQIDIGRKKSLEILNYAQNNNKQIFVTLQKNSNPEYGFNDLENIGTVVEIRQVIRLPRNNVRIVALGVKKCKIIAEDTSSEVFSTFVEPIEMNMTETLSSEVMFRKCKEELDKYIKKGAVIIADPKANFMEENDPEIFSYLVADNFFRLINEKQEMLKKDSVESMLEYLLSWIFITGEKIKIETEILNKVRKNVDENQKEYFLREQAKVISEELGDNVNEIEIIKEKIKSLNLNEKSEKKLLADVNKLTKLPSNSPEYGILMNYFDCIFDLPWNTETQDTEDIKTAEMILDEDHYGLEDVKQRILEYIAVYKLTESLKAPILCFVGPPGVGKTSIASSIARALSKNFVRMSLGGVKDEAEIRGHRRTYIGAMPGRIIYNMTNASSINPVFLLDEIDKMSSDFRGDPSSALLEVLDPEQNSTFVDHYLEIPFDLSKSMFIATANTLNGISQPLLDRMEVIELGGYTDEEKFEIAKKYLVPKAMKNTGITNIDFTITDKAIYKIINEYTCEAGVRGLEKEINSVCRKCAKKYVEDSSLKCLTVDENELFELLKAPRYKMDSKSKEDSVGLVNGLAWTGAGGSLMSIEAVTMPGSGEIILTGLLGDVMKESAKTALDYIKSNYEKFGLNSDVFKEKDIHIHVPEGAVPKEGPSAGVTLATVILSVLTGKKVNHNVAMTGEISLLGNVLPIGGLKEKSLAGFRQGIETILIPKDNESDLEEVPQTIKEKTKFITCKTLDDVFSYVFTN